MPGHKEPTKKQTYCCEAKNITMDGRSHKIRQNYE